MSFRHRRRPPLSVRPPPRCGSSNAANNMTLPTHMAAADADGDGTIDYAEFKELLANSGGATADMAAAALCEIRQGRRRRADTAGDCGIARCEAQPLQSAGVDFFLYNVHR